jgi:ATP-dependent DNA helicase RecQ
MKNELFDVLRKLRKELATTAKIPPYIVFSDVSLLEMANKYPQNEKQFRDIYGVGEEKWKRYGEIFLKEIAAYSSLHKKN